MDWILIWYWGWYHEADMKTGKATYWQLTNLQAFWPGLQADFGWGYCCCQVPIHPTVNFSCLAEVWSTTRKKITTKECIRYLLDHQIIHPTEKYYPLRSEFA